MEREMPRTRDYTGETHNDFLFIEATAERTKGRTVIWKVKCTRCDTICTTNIHSINHSNANACGCRARYEDTDPVLIYEDNFVTVHRTSTKVETSVDPMVSWNMLKDRIRRGGKIRGIGFELTKEDVKFLGTKDCHYCGAPPSNLYRKNHKGGRRNHVVRYSGIDRVDSSKGYALDNVVPCCKHCNWAKGSRTQEEFLGWIRSVYETTGLSLPSEKDKKNS
jgi:5-methylcytosine-specific restriction endonuclease McrA